MSEEFRKAGLSFLKNLGRHSELILDTYLEGEVPTHYEADSKSIDTLILQQVLWRPSANESLHLTSAIITMLNQALKDDRNRQIDLNIGSSLSIIKTLIHHYKEAQFNQNYQDAAGHLMDINQQVFTIIESMRRSVRSLWMHVNSEFGMVSTLPAKIRENELAQKQVEAIISALDMFDFKDLTELAGYNPQLRKMLVVNLQREIGDCLTELLSVQTRLFQILGHFKEMHARSNLIRGFQLFTSNHPEFKPACYPEMAHLPALFNSIEPIAIKGLIDVTIEDYDASLIEIVQSIQTRTPSVIVETPQASGPVEVTEMEIIETEESAENKLVEAFFCHVVDAAGSRVCAGDYYHAIEFNWDEEFWLFAVIGYLYGLDTQTRSLFDFHLQVAPHAEFTGNQFITGIELWTR